MTTQTLSERLRTDVLWHQRRGNDTIARDCQEAADEIDRLREENARLLADAGRYRKWRADYTGEVATEMLLELADAWEPAQVDAAIDAAMKGEP